MRTLNKLALLWALTYQAAARSDETVDTLTPMIEKVCSAQFSEVSVGISLRDQSSNLRTHSLAAPYVDSDLQNRW